jgi:hypothetical protein
MSQSRSFQCLSTEFDNLLSSMQLWFASKNFECQRLTTEDGGQLLQIQKKGGWRKIVGMSTALNVVFRQVENTVNVDIGAGRWIDKAVVATVSILILAPALVVTSAFGAWQQMKIPEKVFDRIAHYLAGSIIKETASDPETQALVLKGPTGARQMLDTVSTGLGTAVSVGLDATQKAGSIIKKTARDPETQALVLKGATLAAREVGFLVGGSIGGRIVERIGEKVGDSLLHGKSGASDEVSKNVEADPLIAAVI